MSLSLEGIVRIFNLGSGEGGKSRANDLCVDCM